MSVKVAIILPSRGLMFSRSAEDILENHKLVPSKFFFAHKRPIPECFEEPTQAALQDEAITHLWYVEDDMKLTGDTLARMVNCDAPAVAYDYPVTKDGKGAVLKVAGEVLYTGTGCLLIKREVFDKLKAPYFRSDIRWTPLNYGTTVKLQGSMYTNDGYGLHDVTFGIALHKAGIPISVIGVAGQRKLVALGEAGTNNGQHKIEEWTRVRKDYQLKKILSQPLATGAKGELVTVDTPQGGIRVTRKHARTLTKQGVATPIDGRRAIIDDSEVKW